MEIATLCLLVRDGHGGKEILLAMKKVGFGKGKWNGPGGRVEEKDETIEGAARREVWEEVRVCVDQLEEVAVLTFTFVNNPEWDQEVHVFLSTSFEGEPKKNRRDGAKMVSYRKDPLRFHVG